MIKKVIFKLINIYCNGILIWRKRFAQSRGVKIGKNVKLGPSTDFNLGKTFQRTSCLLGKRAEIVIGDWCWIEKGAVLWAFNGSIRLGKNVFLGPYVTIYGHGNVDIGDQTLVSMHATILSSNHTIPDKDKDIRSEPDILLPTKIGRDCWIGANAVVLGGVTVGDGCVVGAGSVVSKNLPAYSVAVGVPAKVVRMRT
jgi:acetyltransferase-like isoleucine patch superfamily enzyme